MTGLPASRHIWIACFWTIGTCSSGSSTPKSPRATITPSKASTIPARLSTAWGFSTLARIGIRRPTWSMIACTSLTSSALRTNDRKTMSAPMRRAHVRSSLSLSDRAGTLTATPGRLIPLLLLTGPPSRTFVMTRGPSTETTSSFTLPSSTRTVSPGLQSSGRPLWVVPHCVTSPRMSSVVIVNSAPLTRSTGPFAKRPSRIFGPWRSATIPTPWPSSFAARRTLA